MRIKANNGFFRTYLDKKRFFLLPEEQKVISKMFLNGSFQGEKAYKRKVWQDTITEEKWAYVHNGYWKLKDIEGHLIAEVVM